MQTMRVFELAKEMDLNSKVLLDTMTELGLPMKHQMSPIPGGEVNRIKSMVYKKLGDPRAEEIALPKVEKEKPVLSGLKRPALVPTENKPAENGERTSYQTTGPKSTVGPVGTKPYEPKEEKEKAQAAPQTQQPAAKKENKEQQKPQSNNQQQNPKKDNKEQQKPVNNQSKPQNKEQQKTDRPNNNQGNRPNNNRNFNNNRPNNDKQGQNGGNRPNNGQKPFNKDFNKDRGGFNKDFMKDKDMMDKDSDNNGRNFQRKSTPKKEDKFAKDAEKFQGKSQTKAQQNRFQDKNKNNNFKNKGIGKDNADRYADFGANGEEDSRFLNKIENAVGDRAFDRGGISKNGGHKKADANGKRPGKFFKDKNQAPAPEPVVVKNITLDGPVTVQAFSNLLNRKSGEVIMKLMGMGLMATLNQELDMDTLILLGEEFGCTVEARITNEDILSKEEELDNPEDLVTRPPVVTIMGHVDHGKTSLLDAIRKTNVQSTEAGGITQRIGAYQVEINRRKITFLDTPGHEAFTAMRARGAQCTDIAVLVVAADDGVMPQTIEAINHSKAAGVPIIVAVNKIDKDGANPDRVRNELSEYGVISEEWGGDTIFVNVSAKAKLNIDSLLEMILLVADMGELKANPNRNAKGVVIESKLDKGRGPVATVLVGTGTLKSGDFVIAGTASGRVRAMNNEAGKPVKKAGPSMPVEIVGLSEVPSAGETFQVVNDERLAKQIVSDRSQSKREEQIHSKTRISLDDLFNQIKTGEVKDLNIIIKADEQGSIEALRGSLEKLSNDEVRVNTIHTGVGGITETDVNFAAASGAIILGFNVRPDGNARKAAENQQVDIRLYNVIYNAIDDIKAALTGMLNPDFKEKVIGRAEVRQVIRVPKVGAIAGSYVTEGKITRGCKLRVIRGGIVIFEGEMTSLRRFKDDVKEVAEGYECGIGVEKFNDLSEGDQFECFVMEEVKRELE